MRMKRTSNPTILVKRFAMPWINKYRRSTTNDIYELNRNRRQKISYDIVF